MMYTKYRCSSCLKTFSRRSHKKWISSYCSHTGIDSRLISTTWLKEQRKIRRREWKTKMVSQKNIEKFQEEWLILRIGMRPHWKRYKENIFNTHSFVNLFVEARRLSPYITGHVDCILYPTLLLLICLI